MNDEKSIERKSGVTRKERDCLITVRQNSSRQFPIRLCEIARLMGVKPPSSLEIVGRLEGKGLVKSRNGMVKLTAQGQRECDRIILNHRVFESLFVQSGIPVEDACRETGGFDYFLDRGTVEAVLQKIGNPEVCPHGRPIKSSSGKGAT